MVNNGANISKIIDFGVFFVKNMLIWLYDNTKFRIATNQIFTPYLKSSKTFANNLKPET